MRAGQEISTIFLVLRRLRGTLIALVLIYAISVLGLTLVPGPPDASGASTSMSFFHAFYFVSYTATTIGFGEIPNAFSEQQRLWTTVCIYLSVIGWAVFIGKLLQLAADENLQRAIRASRFAHSVRHLREPFYIVCGYGETGRLICSALDQMGLRVVVLEVSAEHLAELELANHSADMLSLVADAANPTLLTQAGLQHRQCRGIAALTDDDQANRAIALSARLLAPSLPVLARATSATAANDMASFGTHHIIDPFMKFSRYLGLALHGPEAYQLLLWLTGLPGTLVQRHRNPPRGRWILLGYGRFSQQLASTIAREGMPVTVIDLLPCPPDLAPGVCWIQGDGTTAPVLDHAGVRDAAGIIAATSNDVDNLSACYTARELNPALFSIVRQNGVANQPLFERFHADLTMVPSEVIAHECLAILTTPMLAPFLQAMQQQPQDWCESLLQRLTQRLGWAAPEVWSVRVSASQAPALHHRLNREFTVRLGDLLQDHSDRSERLLCEVLQLDREGEPPMLLPDLDMALVQGDKLLLAGRRRARGRLELVLRNAHALDYVLTGREPSGWLWQKLQT
jgi:voltage-gated potassium channel